MNALQLLTALVTSPYRIVKMAYDYERREVRHTAVGWNPAENTEHAGAWTRVEPEDSPSGEVEYYWEERRG